jgi:imidazolonepropionase-like amidohydrolase
MMLFPLLAAALLAASPPIEPRPLVLAGGTIVNVSDSGRGTADVRDAVIVMRGGKIVAAGPRKTTKIPAGTKVIRIEARTLCPDSTTYLRG